MKVKTHFALFVSILAARVRESACVNSRERLKEAFIQQLILAKRFICSVIARTGVRRADDIEDVYQETCLRLTRYFDRLLIENPVKLLRIAFNIKAYLAKAANRTAITWLRRGGAREEPDGADHYRQRERIRSAGEAIGGSEPSIRGGMDRGKGEGSSTKSDSSGGYGETRGG